MCGEPKNATGTPKEGCCDDSCSADDNSTPVLDPKFLGEPTPARHSSGIECLCFYVPSPWKDQHYEGAQISPEETSTMNCVRKEQNTQYPGPALPCFSGSPVPGCDQDICEAPPHENFAIPYPRPAPSVELRGGQIYSGCQCVKRDGLQHDCPRTGCQGKAHCMAYPAPLCVPSGNAPPTPPSDSSRQKKPRGWCRQDGAQQGGGWGAGGYNPPGDDDPYVKLGRHGYRENPPVKQRRRVPCEEHRKPRC